MCNVAATAQTIHRTIISSVGCFADIGKIGSAELGAYGYIFSTPFAIASHMNDPYLNTQQKYALSGMEIGLAAVGIAIACFTPVGWLGVCVTAVYAGLSYAASAGATYLCEEDNEKRGNIQ
jgi:hypothetical protein